MEVATSYFANIRKLADFVPVSIALWPPKGFRGTRLSLFCPPDFLIRGYKAGEITESEYREIFTKNILDVLPEKNTLERMFANLGSFIVLLCYEKPGDFCHRHMVAERLSEMGIPCHEAGAPKARQLSLLPNFF